MRCICIGTIQGDGRETNGRVYSMEGIAPTIITKGGGITK